ncbi:MAG: arylsulfotransferase family protein [Planctomycetota bacterium]
MGLATTALAQADAEPDIPIKPYRETGRAVTPPYPGYHVDLTTTGNIVRIVDLDGQLVRQWASSEPDWAFAELVKPLPRGHILALMTNVARPGPPHRKRLTEYNWDGEKVWEFDPGPLDRFMHHDFERLPNGNTIFVVEHRRPGPVMLPEEVWDDMLMEVDPAGNIVWEWSSTEHAEQMPVPASAWAFLATTPATPKRPFHLNSIQTLPPNPWEATDSRFAAGNLLLSYRVTNTLIIVERSTGNVVWGMHNQTLGQHHARIIPAGLRGAGNMLIFDNGGRIGAPPLQRNFSRVIEIVPTTGQLVWEYVCPGGADDQVHCTQKFYTQFMGSAQRLPNGNTLICESGPGRVFEVDGLYDETVWQRRAPGQSYYRGYRWELYWPGHNIPRFIW